MTGYRDVTIKYKAKVVRLFKMMSTATEALILIELIETVEGMPPTTCLRQGGNRGRA